MFSIFHDGGIWAYALNGDDLELDIDIDIQYLAERVRPDFNLFHVSLKAVRGIVLEVWAMEPEGEDEVISSLEEIFIPEPEILSAKPEGNAVCILCLRQDDGGPGRGGSLLIEAEAAEVTDEGGRCYSLEELVDLANGYWDEWAKRRR